jgi:hypothetical protein
VKHLFTFLLLLAFACLSAQQPTHTVFLIGDAGNEADPGPSLRFLGEQLSSTPNGSVVFLGDNIYPAGLHLSKKAGDTTTSERNLVCQLEVVKNYKGNVIFVPGNHDWDAGKWGGLKAIKTQEDYVEGYRLRTQSSTASAQTPIMFSPKAGLPGPESFVASPGLRFVFFDTQWFLQPMLFHKVDKLPGKSRRETADIFFNQLDSLLAYSQKNNERVMLFYHHPMYTNGGHGAAKQPLRFLVNYTPLQVLGLIGGNRYFMQDIPQPRFKRMRNRLLAIENKYKGIINASGHEHYMQLFQYDGNHYIVSGSGSKLSHKKIDKYKEAFSEDKQPGFAKVMYYADGKMVVEYWGATDRKVLATFMLD